MLWGFAYSVCEANRAIIRWYGKKGLKCHSRLKISWLLNKPFVCRMLKGKASFQASCSVTWAILRNTIKTDILSRSSCVRCVYTTENMHMAFQLSTQSWRMKASSWRAHSMLRAAFGTSPSPISASISWPQSGRGDEKWIRKRQLVMTES